MQQRDFTPLTSAAISPETAAFNTALEAKLASGPPTHAVAPPVLRQAREEGRGVFPSGGPLEGSVDRAVPTPLGRVRVSLPDGPVRGVHIHYHGGGWTLGAPHLFDAWAQFLANAADAAVVSVPYRLAPEHRWPACADDALAGALWVLEHARDAFGSDRITIGGESAGAHLAAVTLGALKAEGMAERIAGALFHYGVFDLSMTPSMRAWGERNMILSTPTVAWFCDNLLGDAHDPADPTISPLYADLSGMPPALFQCGGLDPLLDDTMFMAARWAAAGGKAETRFYPGGVHAFDMFDLTIASEARAAGAAFLLQCFKAG